MSKRIRAAHDAIGKAQAFKPAVRLLWKKDGAVTVLSVIVMSSLLLFSGMLIDYARIAALHHAAEGAARSGARSTLSAFDSGLYERYGLFGRGGTDGQSIYEEVVKSNLERKSSDAQRAVDAKLLSAHVNDAEYLGMHRVFQRQVLEEMKYKAPVDFTLELASKFAPMSGAAEQASITMDLLERLRKLYEQREALLDKALKLQQAAATELSNVGLDGLLPTAANGGGITAAQIAAGYSQYTEWMRIDEELVKQELPALNSEAIANYRSNARDLMHDLGSLNGSPSTAHDKLTKEAMNLLTEAQRINKDMKQIADEAERSAKTDGYHRVSSHNVPGSGSKEEASNAAAQLEELQKTAGELVLADVFFTDYRRELERQSSDFSQLQLKVNSFRSVLSSALAGSGTGGVALGSGVAEMIAMYRIYDRAYLGAQSVIKSRQQMQVNGELRKQRQEQEKKAGSLWSQARRMLNGIGSAEQQERHVEQFQQVKLRQEANLQFNQLADDAVQADESDLANTAHDQAEGSFSLMDGLFNGMADMLQQSRDSVYTGEYVLKRYSVFKPQYLKEMVSGGEPSAFSDALALHNQEAEYILYGFHTPAANVAAAYGELFAVRMAIRTTEGLVQCRTAGHPLLVLTCSVIYGLEKTMEDFVAFTERGSAPLSKYAAVEVSYADYLRLFMLLHGGADSSSRTARMIAVIEQKNGVTLAKVPTALTGEVQAAVDLWFLPGAMKTIGGLGLLQGKVVGSKYETTQTIGWSY
ncbi:TadE/TadG family type IV pilus assembly protein [Paenibacillus sp. NEAU-GSW1]|uniref:TadE/TadG family type IV pilus assembly protein n=1 Tax=Paenibacillus sp. NEAU-GSW1 TaxID=2682486 RepID=UPI0012E1087D|nr:pilus assembly protein [Paenibacillus sp. NEAU-GSW1]MUT68069.1 hypothetical protein [Paenibacillus sp. NEAU-GSW1]